MSLNSRIRDKNIWLVYGAIFSVGIAYGLSIAIIPLFLDAPSFGKAAMGGHAAIFASGICLLSLPVGPDPVRPLLDETVDLLRQALKAKLDAFQQGFTQQQALLQQDADWNKLGITQRDELTAKHHLTPAPAVAAGTPEELPDALDDCDLDTGSPRPRPCPAGSRRRATRQCSCSSPTLCTCRCQAHVE